VLVASSSAFDPEETSGFMFFTDTARVSGAESTSDARRALRLLRYSGSAQTFYIELKLAGILDIE
jgi:hypothetical protein